MYKVHIGRSLLRGISTLEGEMIEQKIVRIMEVKEPIKDGAPLIYTERKDGVVSAYNIRTDRWEIACEAMDVVHKSRAAQAKEKAELKETKVIDMKPEEGRNVGEA